MSHTILSVAITCGLFYILFDGKRECSSVFFLCIAEQYLHSIFIRSTATRCRDRNRCAGINITGNIFVSVSKVNSLSIPFRIDFEFIAISKRERLINSCCAGWFTFSVQNITSSSVIEIIGNVSPHHIGLLAGNFSISKPSALTVLTINLGIHVSCQVLHASRQTGHPLRIGLAVKLNTCCIGSNARKCKACFEFIFDRQIIIRVVRVFFN